MKEILNELNKGNTILIEQSALDEFHKYIKKEPDLYSFRYEYVDSMVKITLVGKHTIIKLNAEIH